MAITTLDYEARRALVKAISEHVCDVQWDGRITHPNTVGWRDIDLAVELGLQALEAAGYRIVKT